MVWESQRIGPTRTPSNQSIRGVLAVIFDADHPRTAIWLLCVLVALTAGMFAAWLAHHRGQDVLALAIVGMTMTTVSPFSWGHHWVWFVPLAVYIAHRMLAAIDARRWGGFAYRIALTAGLFVTVFIWKSYYPHHIVVGTAYFPFFYGIGLFMIPVWPGWRWFVAEPYLWVFAGHRGPDRSRLGAAGADVIFPYANPTCCWSGVSRGLSVLSADAGSLTPWLSTVRTDPRLSPRSSDRST